MLTGYKETKNIQCAHTEKRSKKRSTATSEAPNNIKNKSCTILPALVCL